MHKSIEAQSGAVVITAIAVLVAFSTSIMARAAALRTRHEFKIPAQALDTALLDFSDQAQVQVLKWAGAESDAHSPGATGNLSALTALKAMLDQTGFYFQEIDGTTVAIVRAGTSGKATADRLDSGAGSKSLRVGQAGTPRNPAENETVSESTQNPENITTGSSASKKKDQATEDIQEVVVTGSHLAHSGYDTPTPVTVIGAERSEKLAITNSADLLQSLPSFRTTSARTVIGGSNPTANLRGLGAVRTLVLVDGRRFVPSNADGTVDLNLIPSVLVSRTEVVTGGASAAYGADAVAGVANFILDKRFTGLKAQATTGITEKSDDKRYQLSLVGGTSFGPDRGHFVAGAEYENDKGTGDCYTRAYCWSEDTDISNPLYGKNGLPGVIIGHAANARASTGGVILSNARALNGSTINLRGIAFAPDGSLTKYQFGDLATNVDGTPANVSYMLGGGEPGHLRHIIGYALARPLERYTLFSHAEYELSDAVTVFAEGSYGHDDTVDTGGLKVIDQSLTIRADNAFLPASIRKSMVDQGIASFTMGRLNQDLFGRTETATNTARGVLGVNAKLGAGLQLDAYYQYGRSKTRLDYINDRISANFSRALAAVFDPANPSKIICRSTITDRSNGCQPIDLFGINQFSQAAYNYISGNGFQNSVYQLHVGGVTVSGSPFSTWAGKVAIATGGEYRLNKTEIRVDPLSQSNAFALGNPKNSGGNVEVAEGFAEINVPLAHDIFLLNNLEANAAARQTRTKVTQQGSGFGSAFNATTWKLGGAYEPIETLRLRVTRSRDIRAPNSTELFTPPVSTLNTVIDRVTGAQGQIPVIATGNIAALPEKADTFTAGVALRPHRIFQGMQITVDYYNIDIKDILAQTNGQTISDRCAAGDPVQCALITRSPTGDLVSISSPYRNFGSLQARGIDIDFSYNLPLERLGVSGGGALTFRGLATHAMDLILTDARGPVQGAGINGSNLGQIATPSWVADVLATYTVGGFSLTAQEHFISPGFSRYGEPQPGDRGYSLTNNPLSVNTNDVPARFYTNLFGEYHMGEDDRGTTVYAGIYNLFNRNPPVTPTSNNITNPQYYDTLLRRFTLGVRYRF
jgi:iron complex outermembrane recepter protein